VSTYANFKSMPPDLGVFNTYTTDVEQGIFRINRPYKVSTRIRDDPFRFLSSWIFKLAVQWYFVML